MCHQWSTQRAPLNIISSQFSWLGALPKPVLQSVLKKFLSSLFLLVASAFHFAVQYIPSDSLYISYSAPSVPSNEKFHWPLPCSGKLLPILQDSLMDPHPSHFPLPGRYVPPFPSHSSFISHHTLQTCSLSYRLIALSLSSLSLW